MLLVRMTVTMFGIGMSNKLDAAISLGVPIIDGDTFALQWRLLLGIQQVKAKLAHNPVTYKKWSQEDFNFRIALGRCPTPYELAQRKLIFFTPHSKLCTCRACPTVNDFTAVANEYREIMEQYPEEHKKFIDEYKAFLAEREGQPSTELTELENQMMVDWPQWLKRFYKEKREGIHDLGRWKSLKYRSYSGQFARDIYELVFFNNDVKWLKKKVYG